MSDKPSLSRELAFNDTESAQRAAKTVPTTQAMSGKSTMYGTAEISDIQLEAGKALVNLPTSEL